MTNFTGEWYEVGVLWSEPKPNLSNNYSSALGQLCSLEQRFHKNPNRENLYQQSIDIDEEKGFVNILEVKNPKWGAPSGGKGICHTPSSAKHKQAWRSKRCLKCCIKIQWIMPKQQATCRKWSVTPIDRNNIQILRRTNSLDNWHRIDVSTSANSRTC